MIEYLGYACALGMGIILGLTGGGGAIMTVPILVYVVGLNPIIAAAYSLFIVGTTAAFGTIQNIKNGNVMIKTGLLFAFPSLIGVYISRMFLIPLIPDVLLRFDGVILTSRLVLLTLFAIIMIFAALPMIRDRKEPDNATPAVYHKFWMPVQLFFAGVLVGLVGAGGGFLFIPLLIFVAKLPIRKAAATSLMIIAINSLIGFTGDLSNLIMDWKFLFVFTIFSVIGIYSGIYLNKFVNEKRLKTGFGYFVLVMAAYILIKEILLT